MSAEEETNILPARQHLAHEQREKEEKLQKEMEQRSAQYHPFYAINLGWV